MSDEKKRRVYVECDCGWVGCDGYYFVEAPEVPEVPNAPDPHRGGRVSRRSQSSPSTGEEVRAGGSGSATR
jgi:hypothetical protein